MKKLIIIAATAAALLFGQAAMANGSHGSSGHGGGVKWSVHWNVGGHGNKHNNGHRSRGGHAHQPRHKPRRHQPRKRSHCHTKYRHGHQVQYCHFSHGGSHKRGGRH